MPFAAGAFSLFTPGNPVVTGTTISSTWGNNTLSDIATGLSTCMLKDGTQTITANIPMSSFKFTALTSGTASTDSVILGQLGAVFIAQASVDASATASIDFTGLSGLTQYQQFLLRISRFRTDTVAAAILLYVRVSTDGTTFAGNGDYKSSYLRIGAFATAGITAFGTLSASGIIAMRDCAGGTNAEIVIDCPTSTTLTKIARTDGVELESASGVGGASRIIGAGNYSASTSAISALRLTFSTGLIASGYAALYGIRAP